MIEVDRVLANVRAGLRWNGMAMQGMGGNGSDGIGTGSW